MCGSGYQTIPSLYPRP